MTTGFLLSVSIRVHPWLDHIGCSFAALRCIAELHSTGRWKFRCVGPSDALPNTIRRDSAIQQIENLRYGSEPTAIPAAEARLLCAILGQQMAIDEKRTSSLLTHCR
jgi:hypothetical protein